jgi:hypothetical protein
MALTSKNILITITTEFGKAGIDQAKAQLNDLKKAATGVAAPLKQAQTAGSKLGSVFGRFSGAFKNASSGFGAIGNAIKGMLGPLNLFDSIFGRVTVGLLTWRAWQVVANGFTAMADAIVGGNARMQVALNTFTALAKGNEQVGQMYVDIVRQIAGETGSNIDSMLANAKRLPTQVGQNFKAFTDLTKTALVLGMIDPVQGVEGAMLALTNAMEGTAAGFRSLLMRFEIGTMEQIKRILEETSDPLEAINKLLEEGGINVDEFIKAQMNTLPVAFSGIVNAAREFLRILGEPVVAEFTKTIVSLRDWLVENRAQVEGLARAIGDRLLVMFLTLKEFIKETFFGGQQVTPQMLFGGLMNAIAAFIEWLLNAIASVLEFLATLAEAIAGVFGGAGKKVTEGAKITGTGRRPGRRAAPAEEAAAETPELTTPEAIDEIVTRPMDEIRSALLGVREGGKETIEQFVLGMLDGLKATDLEKLSKDILKSVLDLEAQELQQEKAIKNLEDWVDQAEKEVQAARDKLKLFDLATEDIPERFTRARRRQLELEVMAAENEQRRRKEALEIAREQLAATKEQLQAQRQVLQLIDQQLKKVEEEGGEGIFKGFVAPDIDLEALKKQVEEFRKKFAEQIDPLFDRIEASFGRMADAGIRIRDAVQGIIDGIKGIIGTVDGILSSLGLGWENLDPGLRTFLLGVAGLIAIKTLIPITLSIGLKAIGALTSAALGGLMTALAGGGVGGSALILPVAILIAEVWLGREELSKWLTGERQLQLFAILAVKASEGLNKLLEFFGADFRVDPSGVIQAIDTVTDRMEQAVEEKGVGRAVADGLTNAAGEVWDAAETAIFDPITQWATDAYNAVVGQSIIPDMLTAILDLFTQFPARMTEPLAMIHETIMTEMHLLRDDWIMDWDQMAAAVERTLELQQRARESSLNRASQQAAQAARRSANQRREQPVNLNLDARETRRLMEEGVYRGMARVAPGEV